MRVIKKSMLILFTLSMSLGVVHSQTIHVEKISIPVGLSSTTVKRLFQDSYGLIWITTEDELNVYDKFKIKIF